MNARPLRLRPTGQWLIVGPILLCMWIAAVNHANNLVYAILYLVITLTVVSAWLAWQNLRCLRVTQVRLHAAFAGDPVRIEIFLRQNGKSEAAGLVFFHRRVSGAWRRRLTSLTLADPRPLAVPAGDTTCVLVSRPTARRGRFQFEELLIQSGYPLGLFWAQRRIAIDQPYFVYPAPRGSRPVPPRFGAAGVPAGRPEAGDDFAGLRPYTPGESMRQVDWKSYARGRPLAVKQFAGNAGQELFFSGDELPGLGREEQLGQLAQWILQAEAVDLPYALKLGAARLAVGLGAEHKRRALELLAIAPAA